MALTVTLTLTTPHGRVLTCAALGNDARERLGLPEQVSDATVILAPKLSKAGNTYYEWNLNNLPLPDGLSTGLAIDGVPIKMGSPTTSKSGNLMVDGHADLNIAGERYRASGMIVTTRRPYWVKVIVHSRSGRPSRKV